MRYGIEQYDQHGFLKAPIWLWLGCAFLIRAWVVFVVAGASRQEGSQILQYVYPNHTMLYLGLMMGLPVVLGMWLLGLRTSESHRINYLVSFFRGTSLIVVGLQLLHTVYLIRLEHWQFSWANAITLVLLVWFAIYLVNSRDVKDCLSAPQRIVLVNDPRQTPKS